MTLNDVPQPGQTLAGTQNPIRTNFTSIDTAFAVDHVPYNTAGAGQHNKVTLPLQGATPVFGGLNGLWSELYAGTAGVGEIWVNSRNGNQYPMTASVLSQTPNAPDGSDGWTFLPSGILIKWGLTAFNLGTVFVSLAAIGPALSAAFGIQLSAASGDPTRNVTVQGLNTNGFSINSNTTGITSVYWIVYGR